jgi:plasmid stabilization system protein ParE
MSSSYILIIPSENTPSHDDPCEADRYYKAVGLLVVAWGRFGSHFLLTCINILSLPEAAVIEHKLQKRWLPDAWPDRAEYWRAAFDQIPSLQSFKEGANQLMDGILTKVSEYELVGHGLWKDFSSSDPMAMDIIAICHGDGGVYMKSVSISVDRLASDLKAVNELNDRLRPISMYVCGLRTPPEDAQIL